MNDPLTIPKPAPSPSEPVPDEFDLLCEQCGYSLVGLIHTTICPECGTEFDPKQLPLARVPWLFRVRLGTLWAYLETVRFMLRHPVKFGRELCRPIRLSAEDARQFRRLTGWIAATATFIPLAMVATLFLVRGVRDGAVALVYAFAALVGIKFFAHFATDMPTFIWRGISPHNPSELSPLQHYASAPIAFIGVPVGLVALAVALDFTFPVELHPLVICLSILASAAALLIALGLWSLPVVFMRVAERCSVWRAILLAVYLPFHWAIMATMSLLLTVVCTGVLILAGMLLLSLLKVLA